MYCSKCGKKITGDMLFCPFCGAAVVIPEQREEEASPVEEPRKAVTTAQTDVAPVEPEIADIEEFEPLDFEDTLRHVPVVRETKTAPKRTNGARKASRETSRSPQLSGHAPKIAGGRRENTYTPRRQFDPEDIFMEGEEPEEEEEEIFEYEERERGGFFVRHLRGFIAFIMLLVLMLCMGVWLFSSQGQRFLAYSDLAWTAAPYADAARESFEAQAYAQAAIYYEKAFAHTPQDAGYAVNASISYIWAQDYSKAEQLARQAIALDPYRVEPYQVLLRVYPDASTRPADVTNLIRDGYARTKDPSLDIS